MPICVCKYIYTYIYIYIYAYICINHQGYFLCLLEWPSHSGCGQTRERTVMAVTLRVPFQTHLLHLDRKSRPAATLAAIFILCSSLNHPLQLRIIHKHTSHAKQTLTLAHTVTSQTRALSTITICKHMKRNYLIYIYTYIYI